jgi:hypothetical protein
VPKTLGKWQFADKQLSLCRYLTVWHSVANIRLPWKIQGFHSFGINQRFDDVNRQKDPTQDDPSTYVTIKNDFPLLPNNEKKNEESKSRGPVNAKPSQKIFYHSPFSLQLM